MSEWMNEYPGLIEWYWQGKPESLGKKTLPQYPLFTIDPTRMDHVSKPVLYGERPVTESCEQAPMML